MAKEKRSKTPDKSNRTTTAGGKILPVSSKRHRRTKAEIERDRLAQEATSANSSTNKSGKDSGASNTNATSTVRPGRSRAAKVEQAVFDILAKKGKEGRRARSEKSMEVGTGTDGDSSRSVCRFCGGSFGSSNGESHLVQLDIRIDDRRIKTRELRLCNECIHWLPQYIGGAMTMEMNMPREEFHGAWTYPPVEMEVVEE